ncbi:MAG: hypothetical protein ABIM50_11450, partial [Novosphingobium sp.]
RRARETRVTTIVLDGLNEEDFRRSIENRLREASPGAAVERLRRLLAPYARPGGILPERFLTVSAADLILSGWEALGDAVARHDKPGRPITAISIAFGWPGEHAPAPDAQGCLRPHIETSYYTDNAYPFSQSAREDLLDGYSFYGCTWSGDCEATEPVLTLEGIDDLHGALALLEAELLAMEEPDDEGIRAGSLGACLLSVLLVQTVAQQITRAGLPRPLCVMSGSSGIYPYFDAPVVGMPEEARKVAEALEEAEEAIEEEVVVEAGHSAPAPRYSSLLLTGIPRAKKRAVLVLNESQDELDSRVAKLRSLGHDDDVETVNDSMPIAAEPEPVDPFALPPMSGPLLAQKPAKHPRDLNEIFGLTAPMPSSSPSAPSEQSHEQAVEPRSDLTEQVESAEPGPPPIIEQISEPPRELAEPVEPALPTPRNGPLVQPGFSLLESDIEQRLRELIAASNPTIDTAPAFAPLEAEKEPTESRSAEPDPVMENVAMPAPESRHAKAIVRPAGFLAQPTLFGRFLIIASAFLARFTRRR